MEVVIHKKIDTLREFIPRWEVLYDGFRDITVFQDMNWLENWWSTKEKEEKIFPYIVEILTKGKTIGILPLYITHKKFLNVYFRVLKPMGWGYSDYILPILSCEFPVDELVSYAFLKIREDKLNWDCIEWGEIPEDTTYHTHLNNFLIQNRTSYKRMIGTVCPYILLNKGIHHVNEKCDQPFLKQICSKEKKLMKKGELKFYKVTNEEDIEFVMNQLFKLHCKRWEHTDTPSSFTQMEEREYATLNAKNLFQSNLLHLSYLRLNNEIVAVHFGMSDGNRFYYYIPAYHIDYKKYSVGSILTYHLIQKATMEGCHVFDFLKGNEGYKWLFGAKGKRNIKFCIYNQTLQSKVYKRIEETYFSTQFNAKPFINQFPEKVKVRVTISTLNLLNKLSLLSKRFLVRKNKKIKGSVE